MFLQCKKRNEKPDFVSPSGSRYWYTPKGVYRQSSHWGVVGTCIWVVTRQPRIPREDVYTGFCKWENFAIADCDTPRFPYRVRSSWYDNRNMPFYEPDGSDEELYGWLSANFSTAPTEADKDRCKSLI